MLNFGASKRNTDPRFVGLESLKAAHAAQIADFEAWAASGEWERFHTSHYDWWTFPIDKPSSYGLKYTVYAEDIAELKRDAAFMERLRRGIELLTLSWGWDLNKAAPLAQTAPGQSWHQWPVRLHKAALAAKLFGLDLEFQSLRTYGQRLMSQGETFTFGRHDIGYLFR